VVAGLVSQHWLWLVTAKAALAFGTGKAREVPEGNPQGN
jgi:hypothetical protein